jgi:hypothetical protein
MGEGGDGSGLRVIGVRTGAGFREGCGWQGGHDTCMRKHMHRNREKVVMDEMRANIDTGEQNTAHRKKSQYRDKPLAKKKRITQTRAMWCVRSILKTAVDLVALSEGTSV